jgi:hypothetical protein
MICVRDDKGTVIEIGSIVTCGPGPFGEVVDITEPEETPGRVFVKWPEFDEPEGFTYMGTGYCWEGPDVCDEVEVLVP